MNPYGAGSASRPRWLRGTLSAPTLLLPPAGAEGARSAASGDPGPKDKPAPKAAGGGAEAAQPAAAGEAGTQSEAKAKEEAGNGGADGGYMGQPGYDQGPPPPGAMAARGQGGPAPPRMSNPFAASQAGATLPEGVAAPAAAAAPAAPEPAPAQQRRVRRRVRRKMSVEEALRLERERDVAGDQFALQEGLRPEGAALPAEEATSDDAVVVVIDAGATGSTAATDDEQEVVEYSGSEVIDLPEVMAWYVEQVSRDEI